MRLTRSHGSVLLLGTLLASALTACNADHTEAVEKLERKLVTLPGVSRVTGEYESGDTLFPGSASVEIGMTDGATDDQLVSALLTAFERFDDDVGNDSGDAVFFRGPDEIRLHVQDSSAEDDDVRSAIRFALGAREPDEKLVLDLNALDDDGFEDLESVLEFHLPKGSDRDDVIPRFDRFDADAVPDHADVLVRAADGSALSGFDGLPTEEDRFVYRRLNEAPYAGSFTVDYGPLNTAPGSSRAAFVLVELQKEPRQRAERNRRRVALMKYHLEAAAAVTSRFRYYVNKGIPAVIQLDQRVCDEMAEYGTGWQSEVARYYNERTYAC